MKTAKDRLASLLTVKSLVTLALTGVFAYMSVAGDISRDFMTIYAVIIAFYFGTQSTRADAAGGGVSEAEYAAGHVMAESAAGGIRSESAAASEAGRVKAALEAGCVKAAPGGECPAPDGGCAAGHVTAEDEYAASPVPGGGSGGGGA